MESFEFRAAFHVCSWLRECHSFDRKTTELIQLFQYTTTRSLMIFSVYVRMNNIITRKIERLRALITLAVCTRPNFRRFVPLRFCVAKIWPGTRLVVAITGSVSFTTIIVCETYNAKTAHTGSSAICAGTFVSIANYSCRAAYCQSGVRTEYIRSCGTGIACEHLSAKSILEFMHRWQMNLHKQSYSVVINSVSYSDDERVSQLPDG